MSSGITFTTRTNYREGRCGRERNHELAIDAKDSLCTADDCGCRCGQSLASDSRAVDHDPVAMFLPRDETASTILRPTIQDGP